MPRRRTYRTPEIEVSYDVHRCIHARECTRKLPAVFDYERRPWCKPTEGSVEEIARVILRCPTGALQFERRDGGSSETPDGNLLCVAADGPLYLRGDVVVRKGDGSELIRDRRVALCRCGASAVKPFCDGSHETSGFRAAGRPHPTSGSERQEGEGEVAVTATPNGPFVIEGSFRLEGADENGLSEAGGALCRCGHSENKPWCDGSHLRVGFEGE